VESTAQTNPSKVKRLEEFATSDSTSNMESNGAEIEPAFAIDAKKIDSPST
jgi:hypothetical protein